MDRFYNDDPENEKPFFGSDENDDDEQQEIEIEGEFYIQDPYSEIDIEIANATLKQQLLDKAIKIAESSFLWSFKSATQRAYEVAVIYRTLELTMMPRQNPES